MVTQVTKKRTQEHKTIQGRLKLRGKKASQKEKPLLLENRL